MHLRHLIMLAVLHIFLVFTTARRVWSEAAVNNDEETDGYSSASSPLSWLTAEVAKTLENPETLSVSRIDPAKIEAKAGIAGIPVAETVNDQPADIRRRLGLLQRLPNEDK